jgi:hypothetical protein
MPVINKPNQHFDATLYTGNGTSQSITNVNFAPDFTWIKDRTSAWNNKLFDSVRGSGKYLISDSTAAEATDATQLSAFLSNGFSVGSQVSVNGSGDAYVSWNWKAGGTAVTNTSGTITSQVSANPTAGFSIVSFASGASGDKTVGHGLGVAPKMIIMKSRDAVSSFNWSIYHASVATTVKKYLTFTTDALSDNGSNIWGSAFPTSSVFGFTSGNGVNANTNCIAYCFAPVDGYSAFGSYTGNGSANGPFVFTGFKPRFILIRRTDSLGGWKIYNTSGLNYNAINTSLEAHDSGAEATSTNFNMDWLSNGFKLRTTYGDFNASSATYIYMAFAEAPFKFANAR